MVHFLPFFFDTQQESVFARDMLRVCGEDDDDEHEDDVGDTDREMLPLAFDELCPGPLPGRTTPALAPEVGGFGNKGRKAGRIGTKRECGAESLFAAGVS